MKTIIIIDENFKGRFSYDADVLLFIPYDNMNAYYDILQWLKDTNIWYHNIHRDISALHYEILYMEDEDAMAFKLKWM